MAWWCLKSLTQYLIRLLMDRTPECWSLNSRWDLIKRAVIFCSPQVSGFQHCNRCLLLTQQLAVYLVILLPVHLQAHGPWLSVSSKILLYSLRPRRKVTAYQIMGTYTPYTIRWGLTTTVSILIYACQGLTESCCSTYSLFLLFYLFFNWG